MSDRAEQAKALIEDAGVLFNLAYDALNFEERNMIGLLIAALTASEAKVARLETGITEAEAKIHGYRISGHWRGESYDDGFNAALEASSDLLTALSQPTTDTNGAHA